MTSVHRITVQKESKYLFFITESLSVSDTRREEKKPNGDFRGRKDGLPGSESLTFRKKKQAFGRKDVSIHRKCPYVLEISPIVFPNISYCYSKSGLKGTLRLPVGNRRQSFLKWQKNRNAIPSEALSPPTRLFPFLVRTINQKPQDICHREKPSERVFFTQASIPSEINDSEESRLSKWQNE